MIHPRMGEAKARLVLQNSRPVWKYLSERVRYLPSDQLSVLQPKYSSSYLYAHFRAYCAEQGIRPETPKVFYSELREFFAAEPGVTFSTSGSRHHYSGFTLEGVPPDPTYTKTVFDAWIEKTATNGITQTRDHFQTVLWMMVLNEYFNNIRNDECLPMEAHSPNLIQ